MVFTAPSWVPKLPFDPPDSIPISEFMLNEEFGRHPLHHARAPFTCGLSGAEYSALEVRDRVEKLARGLSKELGWQPNKGTEWDKVIGVFSLNTVHATLIYLRRYQGMANGYERRLTPSPCHGPSIACLESRRQQTQLTAEPSLCIS